MEKYVKKILSSRVYDVAIETPLQPAGNLSRRLNNEIRLKREDMQPVFSFKIRGAYNKIVQLDAESRCAQPALVEQNPQIPLNGRHPVAPRQASR